MRPVRGYRHPAHTFLSRALRTTASKRLGCVMMVIFKMPARLILVGAIAVAAFAGAMIPPSVSAFADPGQTCIIKQTNGSAALDCGPSTRTDATSAVSNMGAPSESALTAKNSRFH